jgi:hypothetical protein
MSGQFIGDGPPGLPAGVWVACLGIWVFVPEDASSTDIEYARRMLHRIELDRLENPSRYDALLGNSTSSPNFDAT